MTLILIGRRRDGRALRATSAGARCGESDLGLASQANPKPLTPTGTALAGIGGSAVVVATP